LSYSFQINPIRIYIICDAQDRNLLSCMCRETHRVFGVWGLFPKSRVGRFAPHSTFWE